MVGLYSTIPHIVTIISLWVVAMFVLFIGKKFIRTYATVEFDIDKVIRATRQLVTASAGVSILLVLLFLSSPFQRSEIPTITKVEPSETYKATTQEEIDKTNEEAVTKKSDKNWEEAEEGSVEAMDKADDLFGDYSK
jgi:hypothetical protein